MHFPETINCVSVQIRENLRNIQVVLGSLLDTIIDEKSADKISTYFFSADFIKDLQPP